jgi:copper ion binding protein
MCSGRRLADAAQRYDARPGAKPKKRTQGAKNMTTVTYTVPAISCGHCTHTIETEVGEMKGVQSVKADQATKKVQITFDTPASEESIKTLLAEINYPVEGLITL